MKLEHKTIKDVVGARYGAWAGNPDGWPYQKGKCAESVCSQDRGAIPHQCNRKNGYGPGGLYCRQHDPDAVAKAATERQAKWDSEWAKKLENWDREEAMAEALDGIPTDVIRKEVRLRVIDLVKFDGKKK